ncbi:MAG: hypothetical protein NDI94_06150, partial [Candidatus Woesearchaeota archaeon]|nr:hypothetical protein [Candidatus Woesearchaeota archaeon]
AYDYYVKCKDKVGNIASLKTSFEVQLPPKVEIRYERLPPLPKGTFEIRVEPSKELRELPKLYYRYTDDDEFRRDVSLVKDDEEYIGYVIIEDQIIPRSGQFFFEGYDLQGNKGTEITEGGAFLVDTIKPPSPTDVAIKAENEGVQLRWYYDGEEPDHFNVYRSTANGVGHIHYYDSVTRQEFLDDNVLNSQIYYYRIAAVDDAGNVGSFSAEVNVYAKGKNTVVSDVKEDIPSNPPTKETKDWKDKTQKDLESLLIDLDYAVSNLREQGAKEAAVEELGLIKKATDAKSESEKLKLQLSGLDLIRVSDAELKDILSKGDAFIARTKKLVPQSLELIKSTNSVQATSLSDIQSAIKEFMAKRTDNLSDSDMNFYQKEIEKINEKIRVELAIKTLELGFIDGSKENRVLVKKEFSYDNSDPLLSAIALEIIPKSLAADISSVDIRTPDYYVLNEDPVVSFSYGSLGYEKQSISYVVMANDDSEGAKNTKLIILKEPEKKKSMLTGFAILSAGGGFQVLGLIFGVIIIVGLGLYYLTIVGTLELPKLGNPSKESQYLGHSPVLARPQEYFHLRNGDIIRGVSELRAVLSALDDITFNYHVHSGVNDFSDWIIKTYNDQELAAKIRKEKTRERMIKLLERVGL